MWGIAICLSENKASCPASPLARLANISNCHDIAFSMTPWSEDKWCHRIPAGTAVNHVRKLFFNGSILRAVRELPFLEHNRHGVSGLAPMRGAAVVAHVLIARLRRLTLKHCIEDRQGLWFAFVLYKELGTRRQAFTKPSPIAKAW